ncbi:MAG: D-alanyl-D-alanine carboxypeptidase [Christensenellaceae bacterium]|jgi:D-alanyl-D-alanine carboxypeptidase (penicillin-binding protein 5/6)|nr:D-alanyl-D-alanine carboxypeptidase [Christensenellaceae bacterium]
MRGRRVLAVLLALFVLWPIGGYAAGAPLESAPPFSGSAASLLLMEESTGQIIFEKNADEQRPVASVTKLMTILLLLEMLDDQRISLEGEVTVSKNAAGMGGSQALLDAGGNYKLEEFLKSLIVASANDSAVALAEYSLGSEGNFVAAMNARAKELGLSATSYQNTTGLPANGQYTSARDVAELSRKVLSHPLYFQFSTIWMDEIVHNSGRKTELVNTNRLVRFYEGADGVKTGSTQEAGYCISASAKRGDTRYIAVVLGATNGKERFNIASAMLDYAFDHYTFFAPVDNDSPLANAIPVRNANGFTADLYLKAPLHILAKKGEEGAYYVEVEAPESLEAPLIPGQDLGKAHIFKNGEELSAVPLTVRAEINPSGFMVDLLNVLRGWPPLAAS